MGNLKCCLKHDPNNQPPEVKEIKINTIDQLNSEYTVSQIVKEEKKKEEKKEENINTIDQLNSEYTVSQIVK